ncbi:hypothetical protein CCH79_00009230 [Gambusia affinis]|uniref:B30.2/SPRY domain-containing protein n=1 Tax=Gambusia affinis TaxID=33528 RepID=A0A315W5S1_GAMAF|nr:hypothetical protein CCH79_00009230 [Gambusia affinis]
MMTDAESRYEDGQESVWKAVYLQCGVVTPVQQAAAEMETDGVVCSLTKLISTAEHCQSRILEVIETTVTTAESRAQSLLNELQEEIAALKKRSATLSQLAVSEDYVLFFKTFPALSSPPQTKDWSNVSVSSQSTSEGILRTVSLMVERLQLDLQNLPEARQQQPSPAPPPPRPIPKDITLDPGTAHPRLIISADGKQVQCSDRHQLVPDNPGRFDRVVCVMAHQGFTSGRHYWEVDVSNKTDWDLGVASRSVIRKGKIPVSPANGYWFLSLRDQTNYTFRTNPPTSLTVATRPSRVGIYLDCNKGLVSFSNVEAKQIIFTYTDSFKDTIHPFFSPCTNKSGQNAAPLQGVNALDPEVLGPPSRREGRETGELLAQTGHIWDSEDNLIAVVALKETGLKEETATRVERLDWSSLRVGEPGGSSSSGKRTPPALDRQRRNISPLWTEAVRCLSLERWRNAELNVPVRGAHPRCVRAPAPPWFLAMTNRKMWGPGAANGTHRLKSLIVFSSSNLVSDKPGVSITATCFPSSSLLHLEQLVVRDLGLHFESKHFRPRMVFPEALFPDPHFRETAALKTSLKGELYDCASGRVRPGSRGTDWSATSPLVLRHRSGLAAVAAAAAEVAEVGGRDLAFAIAVRVSSSAPLHLLANHQLRQVVVVQLGQCGKRWRPVGVGEPPSLGPRPRDTISSSRGRPESSSVVSKLCPTIRSSDTHSFSSPATWPILSFSCSASQGNAAVRLISGVQGSDWHLRGGASIPVVPRRRRGEAHGSQSAGRVKVREMTDLLGVSKSLHRPPFRSLRREKGLTRGGVPRRGGVRAAGGNLSDWLLARPCRGGLWSPGVMGICLSSPMASNVKTISENEGRLSALI